MDEREWLDYLDKDLAIRGEKHGRLWTYGFSLLVAAASLSVFVARTFDARDATGFRFAGIVMAVGLSCSLYFLCLGRAVQRLIRTHPPLRMRDVQESPKPKPMPFLYRASDPNGAALVTTAIVVSLLGTEGWEWLNIIAVVLVMFLVLWIYIGPDIPVKENLRRHLDKAVPGWAGSVMFAIGWTGILAVSIGSLLESLGSMEAGIALLGVACIPALFLAALQILRWVAFDRSEEAMEQLRLNARLQKWDASRIEQAFFRIERARAQGPVLDVSLD